MSQHTPAPWKALIEDDEIRVVEDDNLPGYSVIATIDDNREGEANAHLIAAAPEMYEALKAFAEQKCYGAESGYAPHVCLNTPTCPTCAARAAIDKAEGRQP
jgi:hypothetical protein